MQKIELRLAGCIAWRVPRLIPQSPPIPALLGWRIASPIAVQTLDGARSIDFRFSDDTVFTTCQTLVLLNEDNWALDDGALKVLEAISPYLNALRVVAQQPSLSRSFISAIGPTSFTGFEPPPEYPTSVNAFVNKHMVDSAVKMGCLVTASDLLLSDSLPIHRELANDAAEFAARSNDRSAIVFAAAAIEACAGDVLERAYSELKAKDRSDAHRLVRITVNRLETIVKDPIYESLQRAGGEGGSLFLARLHELPLYLLGQSLLRDDGILYRRAHALYRTRNHLAHTGRIGPSQGGLLELSHDGAIEALKVMNAVIEWFGESGTTIPGCNLIDVGAVT